MSGVIFPPEGLCVGGMYMENERRVGRFWTVHHCHHHHHQRTCCSLLSGADTSSKLIALLFTQTTMENITSLSPEADAPSFMPIALGRHVPSASHGRLAPRVVDRREPKNPRPVRLSSLLRTEVASVADRVHVIYSRGGESPHTKMAQAPLPEGRSFP